MKSRWTPFTPLYSLPHPLTLALICSRYLKTLETRSEATKSSGQGLQQLLCLWHTKVAVKWSITGSLLKILSYDLILCEILCIAICLRASLLFMRRISQSIHKEEHECQVFRTLLMSPNPLLIWKVWYIIFFIPYQLFSSFENCSQPVRKGLQHPITLGPDWQPSQSTARHCQTSPGDYSSKSWVERNMNRQTRAIQFLPLTPSPLFPPKS